MKTIKERLLDIEEVASIIIFILFYALAPILIFGAVIFLFVKGPNQERCEKTDTQKLIETRE